MLHLLWRGDVDLRQRGRAGRGAAGGVCACTGPPRPQSSNEAAPEAASIGLANSDIDPNPIKRDRIRRRRIRHAPAVDVRRTDFGRSRRIGRARRGDPAETFNPSGSGDGGSARLKSDAGRLQMDELGIGGAVQEFDGLRQPQHRRGRKQHGIGHGDDGADRAGIVRVLPVGIAVGSGLLSGPASALAVRQPWCRGMHRIASPALPGRRRRGNVRTPARTGSPAPKAPAARHV